MSEFELIRAEAAHTPIRTLCRLVGVSPSGYYAWLNRKPPQRTCSDTRLLTKIRAVHKENRGVYGSRRMTAELRAHEEPVGRRRVARLMRSHGLQARYPKRFRVTTDSEHDQPIAENLLEQHFGCEAPDRVWAGDITYVWTSGGWCYLAVVLDLFSRRVVGWALATHMRTDLVSTALQRALDARQPEAGLIFHSDRGSQYASDAYRKLLGAHGIVQSMSGVGNCYDNAPVESFFSSLKKECVHRLHFATRTEAYDAVAAYIDGFYNPRRRHSTIGYETPIGFEQDHASRHAWAA